MKQRIDDLIDWIIENSHDEPLILAVVALILIAIAAVVMGLVMALWSALGYWSLGALVPLTIVWLALDDFWTQVKRKKP